MRIALASVRGSEHARLSRNNQDAIARCGSAVAVADGCSEGRSSEVGARLVAGFIARRAAESTAFGAALANEVTDAVVAWLDALARGAGEIVPFVQEHLLTTFLCAVVRDGQALVFGVGDGAFSVDGRTQLLDAGPDNAPPYVAYRLVALEKSFRVNDAVCIHHLGPARRIAIATDGAHPLFTSGWVSQAFDEPLTFRNPVALQRKLNLARGLHDDATLALLEVGA